MSNIDLSLEKNPSSQLYLIEFLASFVPSTSKRQRIQRNPFKIINAIYILTKHNERKGRSNHYWSFALIADVAKCSRKTVSDFVNSKEFEIFCDIKKNTFATHNYFLKDWVYQWFRLFWRSGMMKHLHTRWDWWISTFKKRVKNWLVPLLDLNLSIRDIYERVVNKLSTPKCLTGYATKPLKGDTISPPGVHEASRSLTKLGNPSPVLKGIISSICFLKDEFRLREVDINSITNSFNLREIRGGIRICEERIKSRDGGWKTIDKPVAYFINSITAYLSGRKKYGRV